VRAHKMILVARSEYFRGMFRKGAMREGTTCEVVIESHEEQPVRWMLEYIYTNRVADLHRCVCTCSFYYCKQSLCSSAISVSNNI
jgi:BTB/POZ domain